MSHKCLSWETPAGCACFWTPLRALNRAQCYRDNLPSHFGVVWVSQGGKGSTGNDIRPQRKKPWVLGRASRSPPQSGKKTFQETDTKKLLERRKLPLWSTNAIFPNEIYLASLLHPFHWEKPKNEFANKAKWLKLKRKWRHGKRNHSACPQAFSVYVTDNSRRLKPQTFP